MDPQLPRPGPSAPQRSLPRRCSAGLAAAAVLAGGALLFGVLTPAKPWSHYPVHHDDFANLATAALRDGPRAALAPYPTVAVEGAPPTGPWFGSEGLFLARRHRLDHTLLVLIPAGGKYQRLLAGLLAPEQVPQLGRVMHREIGPDALPPGLPVVRLAPGGGGAIEWPRQAVP